MKYIIINLCIVCFLSLGVVSHVRAQQNSFTSGSDFANPNYQVHVSVGQVFGSYKDTKPLVQEGVLSILIELMVLQLEPDLQSRFQISPNPFTDVVSLSAFISIKRYPLQVDIYSFVGTLLESQWMYGCVTPVSLDHLRMGTYFVRIQVPGQEDFIQKIIKTE
jgi:hypothetical protein